MNLKKCFKKLFPEMKEKFTLKHRIKLPGIKKKEISMELKNGYIYLYINKNKSTSKTIKDTFISSSVGYNIKKSIYVGNEFTTADIKVKLRRGMLSIYINNQRQASRIIQVA